MTDEKEMSRNNYAAQMAALGYEPDGNPKIRYRWIHEEPAKSNRFRCSGCGNTAYYPQANNARKGGLRIPYEYCPFCGRHMITIWEGLK